MELAMELAMEFLSLWVIELLPAWVMRMESLLELEAP
jgi:hypothetical protein